MATWMEMKGLMSSKVSRAQKGKHFMFLILCRRQQVDLTGEEKTVVTSVLGTYWGEVSRY